ncbi:GNAT family N-acetyltransferase [Tersicoccus sp. Bi-70]|uniref:GNAT family N-acetyltransferase n=1 Tax=Tersicoccus sp. Bi-70 TaxID=1897634 RepID=UPI0009753A9E|nr:GNAT family N-acetyltransferase [Tersicoccus sp. Bi-70]OMH37200.1 GNAT family N-acetyltransferase [Tersicoccus sp. Bi-70]
MLPAETSRLRFREMTDDDLDAMAALLGDPVVMTYYPVPKTREQAAAWIAWNQRNYAEHGYGLWIVETHTGEFLGDCGLTWQRVNDTSRLEVGYHIRADRQGRGFATEAAAACRDLARETLGSPELVAIIDPRNSASRRVAEKIGMSHLDDDTTGSVPVRTVMGMTLDARNER